MPQELGHEPGLWSVEDAFRRIDLLQSTVAHHADVIAQEQRLFLIMGDKYGRRPAALQQ
jgi:hypothetical protein